MRRNHDVVVAVSRMAEPAGEVVDVSVGHRKALLESAAKIYLNHTCTYY